MNNTMMQQQYNNYNNFIILKKCFYHDIFIFTLDLLIKIKNK